MRRRVLGEEHPDTLASMNNLAAFFRDRGDLAGAQALQERVVELRRRVLGEEHPDTLVAANNLALTLSDKMDYAGAQPLLEQVVEASRRILGEKHPDTTMAAWNLALTHLRAGNLEAGNQLIEEYLAWLLEAEETSLAAVQLEIRDGLRQLLSGDGTKGER